MIKFAYFPLHSKIKICTELSHDVPCPYEAIRGSPGLTGNMTIARPPYGHSGTPYTPMMNRIGQQIAVCIWVNYVTSCYVTSCSVCPGSSGVAVVARGGGGLCNCQGGRGGRGIKLYDCSIYIQYVKNGKLLVNFQFMPL